MGPIYFEKDRMQHDREPYKERSKPGEMQVQASCNAGWLVNDYTSRLNLESSTVRRCGVPGHVQLPKTTFDEAEQRSIGPKSQQCN